MTNSMIGLRFKLNQNQNIAPDQFLFYNLGLSTGSLSRYSSLVPKVNPVVDSSSFTMSTFNSMLAYYLFCVKPMQISTNYDTVLQIGKAYYSGFILQVKFMSTNVISFLSTTFTELSFNKCLD